MVRLPERFKQNMQALLGDGYEAYLRSFEEGRVSGLRVNELKVSPEEFERIAPFPVERIPWIHNGFFVREEDRPSRHPYYFAGLYYLQEPSAMTPAEILPVEPGDRVLDCCAAPGGKSTELAAKLRGTGVLFSNDISNSRAQALLKNLELFGAGNIVVLSEDLRKMEDRFAGYFDKILIDAPCSGEGMFRKEPRVIRAWEEHGNAFYTALQKQIADSALKMLKPGGKMVYSTCTFCPEEDEAIVLYMKERCPSLHVLPVEARYEGFSEGLEEAGGVRDPELRHCIRIYPHRMRGEGHFIALLEKRVTEGNAGDGPGVPLEGDKQTEEDRGFRRPAVPGKVRKADRKAAERKSGRGQKGLAEMPAELPESLENVLGKLCPDRAQARTGIRNEKVSLRPDAPYDLAGLRVVREGLYLGDLKNGRFEPSQALAMALSAETFDQTVSFPADDPRVLRYLKGETVDAADRASALSGTVLVMADRFPLGFARSAEGLLKNRYLPGWRYQ